MLRLVTGWRRSIIGLGLAAALAIGGGGCGAEAGGEDSTEAEGEEEIADVGESQEALTYGWNHVAWSSAGLYSIICMLDGTCPYAGYCSGPYKVFHAGHKVYVTEFLWRCGYWWAKVQDNYGNTGWMRAAALDPGW